MPYVLVITSPVSKDTPEKVEHLMIEVNDTLTGQDLLNLINQGKNGNDFNYYIKLFKQQFGWFKESNLNEKLFSTKDSNNVPTVIAMRVPDKSNTSDMSPDKAHADEYAVHEETLKERGRNILILQSIPRLEKILGKLNINSRRLFDKFPRKMSIPANQKEWDEYLAFLKIISSFYDENKLVDYDEQSALTAVGNPNDFPNFRTFIESESRIDLNDTLPLYSPNLEHLTRVEKGITKLLSMMVTFETELKRNKSQVPIGTSVSHGGTRRKRRTKRNKNKKTR